MLKTFIFAILFMLVKPVYPADIVAYDRFVHMTPIEQQKVVVTIMELIVELEERYKHEVKKSGFNLERFQEHKEKLRKISAFLFFPEAHAVSHDYGHHLTNMQILLESTDACLYGGWISTMNGNVCTHPELSSDRTKHLYDKSLGCIAPGKISCNPAIFGYQHVARKTLFCVAGNTDSANTSRACMQKALNDESNFSTSTKEERLRHIAESISSPAYREMGKELFGFLVKTCACNQGSPVIAARYQNAIFPHRTCLSLLRMISESDALCSTEGQPLNEGQRNLLNLLKQATESIINENDVDAHYSNILNEFKEKPEYQAVCSSCPPGEKIMLPDNQCKKICPNPDHVRPRREDPDSKCVALCENGTLPPEGGACPTAGIEVVDTPITPPIVDIPGIISGVCQNPNQVRQPNGTCADRPVCKENERFEGPSGQCVCKSDYEKLPNATDCTLKQTTAKPELKLELRTKKTDSAIYDATVDNEAVLPAGGYNIIWTREGVDAPADDTKFNDPAVVTPASSIPLRDDPVIQPADSENAPPTSGSIYQSHPLPVVYVNQQISTILSIGDGDVDANGDGSIPVDTTTNAGTMREGQTNIAERSGFSLEAPLLPDGKTYKVCARLYKGEEFVAEACQTVPAKEAAAVTPAAPVNNGLNGNGMGMPGPMGPTRGGPSDAVFRGIR